MLDELTGLSVLWCPCACAMLVWVWIGCCWLVPTAARRLTVALAVVALLFAGNLVVGLAVLMNTSCHCADSNGGAIVFLTWAALSGIGLANLMFPVAMTLSAVFAGGRARSPQHWHWY